MAVRVQWVAGLMAGGAALILLAAPSVLPSAWVAPLVPLRHATLGMVDQAFDRIKDALPAPRGAKAERPPVTPASAGAPAVKPAQRTAIEGGRVVVSLNAEEQARAGIETETRRPQAHRIEIQAYGSVLDLARVTELTNAYASAKAQLQTAEARAEVSQAAILRAKSLGPYATQVQVETAEGTYRTDQAALAAAQSQLRTLAATAQQEWGPVIGKAIVERAPLITRLIERTDFLVQVTLPPGESLKGRPDVAFAEVPPQSERVALRYVSPATRTDQRIQGVSLFYIVSGDSGLLPGMSTLAFITIDRAATGILVPEEAVVHWQGGAWFYRSLGEGGFARHPLRPDAQASADSFIVEDLDGETGIVLKGAQTLLSEELKASLQVAGGADDDD
ncbi:efflux RND transporter periplasmic adaptor subunit [Methylobacterium organophilum]|uniref:efflux RND transporter periplasmic adaptor subunit n=1 Tax=Methylobacterium organophilum TaxID=410 RepID=UPI001F147429|nr:efflux RND transporter periplasmic adaptor subunit [Methylobacterium organophilum]UMY17343.1 efflux RND transporter periplasmic adaptor subunit [Methylobacterium organophilum]